MDGVRTALIAGQNVHTRLRLGRNRIAKPHKRGAIVGLESHITIPDLRAGFAYVLAALMAPDTSNISGAHFLDRGYEHLVEKLASLGAEVSRESISNKKLVATT